MKNKENTNQNKGNTLPGQKKFRIPYQNIIMGATAFAYFFALQTNQVLASDMWSKAETIMKDVYGKILGISTIAAIVTASVALLLMNFSKTRVKDSEDLMDCLYREDGSDCEGIVTDCRVSEARFPVLTAVANLYLKQQVTFQIL